MAISLETETAMLRVILTTGELSGHEPIDIVFSSVIVGHFETDSVHAAFERARAELRLAAVAAGAHAVVGCRFQHTMHNQAEQLARGPVFTVHAYGTAARRREMHGDHRF
jgi:hypothetical protein